MSKKKPQQASNTIAENRRARYDYHLGETFEAGIQLLGWEMKALRAGRAQLVDTYVYVQNGEVFLTGARISPLNSASTHVIADPDRTRKLLLHKREITRIHGATTAKGDTCVPVRLYWKASKVKCELALASGKKQHDKRATIKEREWNREKVRLNKQYNR